MTMPVSSQKRLTVSWALPGSDGSVKTGWGSGSSMSSPPRYRWPSLRAGAGCRRARPVRLKAFRRTSVLPWQRVRGPAAARPVPGCRRSSGTVQLGGRYLPPTPSVVIASASAYTWSIVAIGLSGAFSTPARLRTQGFLTRARPPRLWSGSPAAAGSTSPPSAGPASHACSSRRASCGLGRCSSAAAGRRRGPAGCGGAARSHTAHGSEAAGRAARPATRWQSRQG